MTTIEKDLILQGSSGVEDKLQELVPETVQFFRDANIKVTTDVLGLNRVFCSTF